MHRLAHEIEELTEVVAKQKKDLTRYKIYQKFMERVLDKSDEVCGIYAIMNCELWCDDEFISRCSLMNLTRLLLATIHSNIRER